MAHYLNYPYCHPQQPVAHDVAALCKSVQGFVNAYKEEGMWGSVEQTAIIGWRLIRKELPDLKTIVVRRPLQEVYQSLHHYNLPVSLAGLAEMNAMLDDIGKQPGVHSINATDLDAPVTCKWLFEYCLELEFDFDWWSTLAMMNIQMNHDDLFKIRGEVEERWALFQQDVLSRMEEVRNCLN